MRSFRWKQLQLLDRLNIKVEIHASAMAVSDAEEFGDRCTMLPTSAFWPIGAATPEGAYLRDVMARLPMQHASQIGGCCPSA